MRYNPDGTLDRSFGANGIGTNLVGGVAITPGGTILIAGSRGGPKNGLDPIVASYAPNGRLNLGFGQGGVAQADLSAAPTPARTSSASPTVTSSSSAAHRAPP